MSIPDKHHRFNESLLHKEETNYILPEPDKKNTKKINKNKA